jgi:hypothetical protein
VDERKLAQSTNYVADDSITRTVYKFATCGGRCPSPAAVHLEIGMGGRLAAAHVSDEPSEHDGIADWVICELCDELECDGSTKLL